MHPLHQSTVLGTFCSAKKIKIHQYWVCRPSGQSILLTQEGKLFILSVNEKNELCQCLNKGRDSNSMNCQTLMYISLSENKGYCTQLPMQRRNRLNFLLIMAIYRRMGKLLVRAKTEFGPTNHLYFFHISLGNMKKK